MVRACDGRSQPSPFSSLPAAPSPSSAHRRATGVSSRRSCARATPPGACIQRGRTYSAFRASRASPPCRRRLSSPPSSSATSGSSRPSRTRSRRGVRAFFLPGLGNEAGAGRAGDRGADRGAGREPRTLRPDRAELHGRRRAGGALALDRNCARHLPPGPRLGHLPVGLDRRGAPRDRAAGRLPLRRLVRRRGGHGRGRLPRLPGRGRRDRRDRPLPRDGAPARRRSPPRSNAARRPGSRSSASRSGARRPAAARRSPTPEPLSAPSAPSRRFCAGTAPSRWRTSRRSSRPSRCSGARAGRAGSASPRSRSRAARARFSPTRARPRACRSSRSRRARRGAHVPLPELPRAGEPARRVGDRRGGGRLPGLARDPGRLGRLRHPPRAGRPVAVSRRRGARVVLHDRESTR